MLDVLIVDDQSHVLSALQLLFEMRGELTVVRASSPVEALQMVRAGGIGVVVQDMNFSEGTTSGDEGAALFREIRQLDPAMPVILMTAWASVARAVELVREGADDYLGKPWDDEQLLKKVTRLLRARELQSPGGELAGADLCGLLFQSAELHAVVSLAVRVAASDASVLITGPNGSGKSTLFRILATVQAQRPANGEKPGQAAVFGHDLAQQPELVRRQIGVVFQHPALDDKLTARENLRFHGMLFGLDKAELATRGEQWLDTLGLIDRADDPIESFSGGMRRRVEIAKALLTHPRLLMMDEASTGLDAGVLRDIWGLLRQRVDDDGLTIALTTHLMHEAEQCDRLAVLSKGKIVAIDTPAGLVDRVGGRVLEVQFAQGGGKVSPEDEQALGDTLGRLAAGQTLDITLLHGSARVEHEQADQWVGPLMDALGERLRAVRVGRPTLEDAYLKLTGHRLGAEEISD